MSRPFSCQWQEAFGNYQFLRWEFLNVGDRFENLETIQRVDRYRACLSPVEKKSSLILVSHRNWEFLSDRDEDDPNVNAFKRFKDSSRSMLRERFDGFVLWETNLPYGNRLPYDTVRRWLEFVARHCFIYLASPYEVIHDRSWLRYEAIRALHRQKLIFNENSQQLVRRIRTARPSLAAAQRFVREGQVTYAEDQRLLEESLDHELTPPPPLGYDFRLIPLENVPGAFVKGSTTWASIASAGVIESLIDRDKVLMVSHKWEAIDQPDDDDLTKLQTILTYINAHRESFRYVFIDFKCVDQEMPIES